MSAMNFLRVLRVHILLVITVFIVTCAIGIAVTLLLPKRYIATTDLVFDVKTPDMIAGMMLPVMPGYMATQVDVIRSDRVAMAVIKMLRLDQSPAVKQLWMEDTGGKGRMEEWFSDVLRKGLQITPATGSNIISIRYTASDPAFAAVVANAFAQVYIDASIELRVDPARQYARWFGEQGKSMRERLETAQSRLSEFQQQKGIVARDEQLDIETARLNDLSAQLTIVQGQTADSRSRERSGADTLPEVMQNSLLQGLKSDIVRQEAKLQETAGNLGRNHPQYQRMELELASLRNQLESETRRFATSFSASSKVGLDREAVLRAAIAAQTRKLLQFRNDRDQLAVYQRDVDAAQNAYDSVTKRYNQTSLESQITQSNISVLNPAVEALIPSSPNIPKSLLISLLIAILLSGGAAFLIDSLDRRIRSVDDLSEMLQVPVLALIERAEKSRNYLTYGGRNPALTSK